MPKKAIVSKDILYFSLFDAIRGSEGCPFCALETRAVHRYIRHLLNENVNDLGVRAGLARSKGYCPRHAQTLLSFKDGLGTAILYKDQVTLFLRFLDRLRKAVAPPFRKRLAPDWSAHAPCPACGIEAETAADCAHTFSISLRDTAMRKAYDACPGLCVRHFLLMFEKTRDRQSREYLLRLQERNLQDLVRELEEFCRKHDYRFAGEPYEKERNSWLRAVRIMTGR